MTESEKRNLQKITEHAMLAMSYLQRINCPEELEQARQTSDACVFNLIQIGEIAKMGLSEETKQLLPNIPWVRVQSLRNKIVHEYEGINFGMIYETVRENLPELASQIDSLLKN